MQTTPQFGLYGSPFLPTRFEEHVNRAICLPRRKRLPYPLHQRASRIARDSSDAVQCDGCICSNDKCACRKWLSRTRGVVDLRQEGREIVCCGMVGHGRELGAYVGTVVEFTKARQIEGRRSVTAGLGVAAVLPGIAAAAFPRGMLRASIWCLSAAHRQFGAACDCAVDTFA